MVSGLVIGLIVLAVLLVAVLIGYWNRFVILENRIDNSWAQIDVQLKKRADLVPNLIETVKGYVKHEKGVLTEITKARTDVMKATTPAQKAKAGNELASAMKSIFAVAENYPKLQASENFKALQEELAAIENKIAYARQHYNDSVLGFNNSVERFPGVVFASMWKKKEKEMLQIDAVERKNIKVKF